MTLAVANRTRLAVDQIAARNAEANCALDFLVYGDDEERGRHADRCVCSPPCSRDYDPLPYRQTAGWTEGVPRLITRRTKALPAGEDMYRGTGIGALYGLGMESTTFFTDDDDVTHVLARSFAPDLAGWNLRKEARS